MDDATVSPEVSPMGLKILNEGCDPVIDIVAIHGLNGHREKTWTANNNVLWLKDLLPEKIPNARIIVWGYDSSTHSTNPISAQYLHDHADTLISDLCLERALTTTRQRPIIFVAHSLGGLVLKSALIHSAAARSGAQEDHRSIYLSTYGIIFAGTPHQGGEGVAWGLRLVTVASMLVNTNPAMLQHLQRDSEEVQRLLRDFAPISNDFCTKFAYETLITPLPTGTSIWVCPKASAVIPGLADAEAIAIHRDHSNMVKFTSADDDGYKKLSGHILLMVGRASIEIRTRWARSSGSRGDVQADSSTASMSGLPPPTTPPPSSSQQSIFSRPGRGIWDRLPPGWTILHGAAYNNNIEGVREILSSGTNPNCKTEDDGLDPLCVAVAQGFKEITRMLLDAGADINSTTSGGSTALREASRMNDVEAVKILIERGADLDLVTSELHDGPLVIAAAKGHSDIVGLLLSTGANTNAQQSGGWAPLHYALLNKDEDMAVNILDYQPDINLPTRAGAVMPLHLAATAGLTKVATRLLDLGADLEAIAGGGLTALRLAVQDGNLETVKMLVERGAVVDSVGADNYSVLEVALAKGHVSIYQFLQPLTSQMR